MGQLQRQLRQGEFDIFKSVPMFESDFVQISKRGTLSNMHGCPQIMTVGIANTNPFDPIPNVMLVAQLVGDCEKHVGCDQDTEGEGDRDTKELELTRLLPLKLVKISIHNRDKLQLRVKLITGRSFYLQLWAPPDKQEELFGYWEELIYLLRPRWKLTVVPMPFQPGTCSCRCLRKWTGVPREGKTQGPACLASAASCGNGVMNSESLFPSYTAPRSPRLGIFNTAMGQLQRQLRQGEFDIFKSVPMFESDFVQISKRGTLSNMHGCPQIMTVGIANTNPFDPIPNVMLVAQLVGDCEKHVGCDQDTEGEGDRDTKELELTRLLPLKLVKISIHNRDKLQLRVKLITGRSFYLQLWAPPDKQEELFGYWEELIYLLRPPVEAYSSTHAVPAGDLFMSVFEEMDRSPKVAYSK
ncbi:Protein FAM71C [Manis javanica]|nr:Protein FAM71C [Manis javanica]